MFDLLRSWAMYNETDKLLSEKIEALQGTQYATLPGGALYLKSHEIEGVTHVEFTIIADLNIQSFCGCLLVLTTLQNDLCFRSDKEDVFTFYSDNMRIGLTTVDFDLTPDLKKLLASHDNESITFIFKGGAVTFNDFTFDSAA